MTPKLILIDGAPKRERFLVVIDHCRVYLQPVCFRIFSILGISRLANWRDGWVETKSLYWPPELVPRYIYRLKKNLHGDCHNLVTWPVVENFQTGDYRLAVEPDSISLNQRNLFSFADHDIQVLLERLTRQSKRICFPA
jgi:hypothetical protein